MDRWRQEPVSVEAAGLRSRPNQPRSTSGATQTSQRRLRGSNWYSRTSQGRSINSSCRSSALSILIMGFVSSVV
ncbi:hypothetical protein D9M68_901090 [compost metagenome]